MKINGHDIDLLDAKQLTVELLPPKPSKRYDWPEGNTLPIEVKSRDKAGTLKLKLLIRSTDRDEGVKKAGRIISFAERGSEIILDGYPGKYYGFMVSNSIEKTLDKRRMILELAFEGFLLDDAVSFEFSDTKTVFIKGVRDVPAVVTVTVGQDTSALTLSGFGDDIVINDIAAEVPVIIDGQNGTVTAGGQNKFADCEMWDFPVLKHGENMTFASSVPQAVIAVKYSPIML